MILVKLREQSIKLGLVFAFVLACSVVPLAKPVAAVDIGTVRNIVFPVAGGGSYSNDYYGARSNGIHAATDIFAPKGRPLVAAVSGTITYVAFPQPSWGYMVSIEDSEGYIYNYIHINNDTPGTDNGNGGPMNAYAYDMKAGNPVSQGQHIGYLGDSGNAESTPPHLHFEITAPDGTKVNPYYSLNPAPRIQGPVMHPTLPNELLPYGPHNLGLSVAMGNFDADLDSELVTGAGKGGGPHVKIFDHDDTYNGLGFMAYHPNFAGGVDVATGDVDGDGVDEIITGPGAGGGPNVAVFELDGTRIASFFAYNPAFTGGIKVATGDVDGDGVDEIITGPGAGGGPNVAVFELDGTRIASFFAYNPAFTGGIDVAGGDVIGTSVDEIVTGAGPGGGPHVAVFNKNGNLLHSFFAYADSFPGGVRVSTGNVRLSTVKSEILTVPASIGGPHARMFDGAGSVLSNLMFLEAWWEGPYDIAGGYDKSRAAAFLNRRATVRQAID